MKRNAQIITALFVLLPYQLSLPVMSQKLNPYIISERFNEYISNTPREEIYLHIDRYYYIAGEDIWFSIYCFDRATGTLSKKSLIAYIELLNPWNVPVLQSRFSLSEGRGEGYFLLPDSLTCGKYTVRAYTNWMKNYLPSNCFMQDIEICNALKENDFYNKTYTEPDENVLSFFPEGGNLVNGTGNRVVVKTSSQTGKRKNYTGIVVNNARDTITSFTLQESGYGVFNLTPVNGEYYYAIYNGESFSLPEPKDENISLRLDSVSEGRIEIGFNISPFKKISSDEIFFMVIRNGGRILMIKEITATGIVNKITIPPENIKPGVNHAVLLSDDGEVLSERLYWLPETDSSGLTALFDTVYRRREKVILKTEVLKDNDNSELSDISISVIPAMFSGSLKGIRNHCIFASEFGATPWTDKNDNDPDPELTDNFLISATSSWINWHDILFPVNVIKRHGFEKDGHHLTLSVRYRDSNFSDSAKFIYMSVQGKVAEFDYAERDRSGRYTFTFPADTRLRNLILQPENANDNMVLEVEQSYPRIYSRIQTARIPLSGSKTEIFSVAGFNYQVNRIYKNKLFQEVQSASGMYNRQRRFYGIPEMEVLLDDYISLPDMLEVFFELVPGIILRPVRSGYEMKITNPLTGSFYEEPPLVMIDGVILNDLKILAELNPEVVEKIEVVRTPYLIGNLILHGIVNVITRSGDFSSISLPDFAALYPCRPVENRFSFVPPQYNDELSRKSRKPDLRNTLYWNPSLKSGDNEEANIEFWTSDLPGRYIVNINGITGSGKIVTYSGIFRVK